MAAYGALAGLFVCGVLALTVAEQEQGPGREERAGRLEAATERYRQATEMLEGQGRGAGAVTEVRVCSGSKCQEFRPVELD